MNITMNNRQAVRMPAEWEPHTRVLMAWPHADTDWDSSPGLLEDARECFRNIISAISANEEVILAGPEAPEPMANVTFVKVPTNDTWARDFGPLTVEHGGHTGLIDFTFNGWGSKFAAEKDNAINRALKAAGVLAEPMETTDFVLEGGSVETDGRGTLLTTSRCLLAPTRNPSMTKEQIEKYLSEKLGFDHYLWLDHGALAGDDTDSHIDTLARLAPGDTIIYCGPGEPGDPNNPELELMREELREFRTREGNPFNLIELPLPSPIYDEDGMQLPATYANYLVGPRHIYLPVYNQPRKDLLAQQTLKIAYPDHEIVPIDCRTLIRQHGSLHCVTMQL